MTVTLSWQGVITAGAVIAALTTMIALLVRFVRWVDKQREQDEEIQSLRQQHESDIAGIWEELAILVYADLACLKGLQEQGCNGPVTEAINRLEKYLNKQAHHKDASRGA